MLVDLRERQPGEFVDDLLELHQDARLAVGTRHRVDGGRIHGHLHLTRRLGSGRTLGRDRFLARRRRPSDGRCGLRLARTALLVAVVTRLDPVSHAVERIDRERDARSHLVAGEGPPVDLATREPEAPDGGQQERRVRDVLLRMAQRRHDRVARPARRMLARQRAERLARTRFEQDPVGLREQTRESVGEAHRRAQVLHPIVRIGRLRLGHPGARDVRDDRSLRRPQLDAPELLPECVEDRLDERRVRRHRDVDAPGLDVVALEIGLERVDVAGASRHHAQVRAIDRGDRQTRADARAHLRFGQRDADHAAAFEPVEETTPAQHHVQRVFHRQHARQAGGGVLAHAVTDQRARLHPEALPEPRRRVLHREERRQRARRLFETVARGRFSVDDVEQRVSGAAPVVSIASRERVSEHRLVFVETARHPGVLRAAAREQERAGNRFGAGRVAEQRARVALAQRGDRLLAALAHEGEPRAEAAASDAQGMRDVGERNLGVALEMIGEPFGAAVERRGGTRREGDQLERPARTRRLRRGRFLDHDVRVGPAESEGADSGAPRRGVPLPRHGAGGHVERARLEIDLRVGRFEVQARRDHFVVDRERGLDEARDGRAGVEMSDVGLHGTQRAVATPIRGPAERSREPLDLDRIAQHGAGAVRLDHPDAARVHARHVDRFRDHLRLSRRARSREAHLRRAVVVDGAADHDRVDVIPVGDRIVESLQGDHGGAAAAHHAGRLRVEGAHEAVGGERPALDVPVAGAIRYQHLGAAGEREIALPAEQALARQMDGDTGRGTRRLHVHGGTAQAEPVRDVRAREVALVADQHVVLRRGPAKRLVRHQVAEQIGVAADAAEDSDAPGVARRVVGGVFERPVGALEQHALLRIHQLGIARAEAEEGRVEALRLGEREARRDVVRIAE